MEYDDPLKDFVIISIIVITVILAVMGLHFIITGKTQKVHIIYMENGQKVYETYDYEKTYKEWE